VLGWQRGVLGWHWGVRMMMGDGTGSQPTDVRGEEGVTHEGETVHQGVGDDKGHHALPPQVEEAEDQTHAEVAEEAAPTLVQMVAAPNGCGEDDDPHQVPVEGP